MTKHEIIREIKMRAPITLTHRFLYSLDMDKLKVYYEKYVPKHEREQYD